MKNSEIKTLVEIGKDLLSLNSKYGQMLCSLAAEGEWLTVAQAAELSGLSDRQIRYKIQQGKINYRKEGGIYKISPSFIQSLS